MRKVSESRQASLFGATENEKTSAAANGSGFSDPAFSINKQSPVHRWVPWIAGFSRTFVSDAIQRHLNKPGVVLDPFAGVGTTVVEAMLAGHKTIGFEINPYAAMACRLKTTAYQVKPDLLRNAIKRFKEFYDNATSDGYTPKYKPPSGFSTREAFYSPRVLGKVLVFHDFVNEYMSGNIQKLFSLAFAATMVTYSNYSYEPSLSRRVTAGKQYIFDFPVAETISVKLNQMADDIEWILKQLGNRRPPTVIYNESFFNCRKKLTNSTVDLIITSPPYLNNYHYNRNTRPHLYWLGYAQSPKDFQQLEESNFGKYWQTVRQDKRVELNFPNPDPEIIKALNLLRAQNTGRGIYGGNGWANYAATYFNDCHRFLLCAKWVLRRRGTALVVIGNNILQGLMIPTDQYLAKIADNIGLKVIDIHIPRETRVGNSIIQSGVRVAKANKKHRLYEAVVEIRKK
jgi:DNA modification methylase